MDNLIYSINVTLPVFSLMVLGFVLRRRNVISGEYVRCSNLLTFRLLLPFMLFNSMRKSDFRSVFDPRLLVFCGVFLLAYVLLVWAAAARLVPDRKKRGAVVQGVFRGNTAVIGVSLARNIYGADLGPLPVMLGVAMVMYNAVSVLVLTACGSEKTTPREQLKRVASGIVTNRIIWGIVLGLVCSLAGLRFPQSIDNICNSIGDLASGVSLIAAGGGFSVERFRADFLLVMGCVFTKLILMPAAALSAGYLVGFRGITLFSLLVMSGVSTATTSVVMARELGCDEALAINILAVTTMCAGLTLTLWVYVLNALALL